MHFALYFLVFVAMKLHYGDLTDTSCLVKIISEVRARWNL